MADISVIIPAYNRAGLIGETLRSLLKPTILATKGKIGVPSGYACNILIIS